MEIRDLDYVEVLSAEYSRISGGQDFDFTKVLSSTANNAGNFDVDVDIDKDVDKKTSILQTVNLTGNSAILFADVEALGPNTEVEVDTSILTIAGEISSISVFAESAAFNPNP
ncbi:MAG: hypothetical protein AAGB13_07210 [Cyanobacteria bacterium P01_F01_bin.33]